MPEVHAYLQCLQLVEEDGSVVLQLCHIAPEHEDVSLVKLHLFFQDNYLFLCFKSEF